MAESKFANLTTKASVARPASAFALRDALKASTVFQPGRIVPALDRPTLPAPPPPVPQPAPAAAPAPAPPVVPQAPGDNPFDNLPFPSPGDRIKADDFKALSQSLRILYDMTLLSANLFGRTYGEARLALGTQGYQIAKVMTVFGNEIADPNQPSLDSRKVIQVLPVDPGTPALMVVLTEEVDTRRFVPNLLNAPSYTHAVQQVQHQIGDIVLEGAPPVAPQLVGLSLTAAMQRIAK